MRRYILIVIFLFAVSFFHVNAQTGDGMVVKDKVKCESSLIYFRFSKSVVDSGYMNNAVSLRELDRILTDKNRIAEIDSVVITASGSPDGVVEYNQALAVRRAKAMKGYIIWKYPFVNQSKIYTYSIGEDWAGLRLLVEADGNAAYKEQILKVLAQDINPSTKEWRLKQIDSGKAWSYITNHYLKYLRAATTCVVYYKKQEVEKPVDQPIESINQPIEHPVPIPQAVVVVEQEQLKEEIPEAIEPIADQPILSPQGKIVKRPQFALKTNLLELAAGVANVGLEVGFGGHFSVNMPLVYSPYTIKRDCKLRIMALQPEFRYWLKEPMRGHFFGLHGTVGWFNVAMDSKNRYQDNRPLWGVGFNYGYLLTLNKHWGAEFTIGGGYANIGYDTYYNIKNGAKLESGTKNYWGITSVGINLVYKFNLK